MSSRPLKVGEMIKRALDGIIREEILEPSLENTSILISEVKVTPDLKNAIIYTLPMTGSKLSNQEFLSLMTINIPKIRKLLCKKVSLRYAPQLTFKIDDTFEEASRLNKLINK
jgi:ribosome-binding factor A